MSTAQPPLDVLVIGAGFSGLGVAIRLKQAGTHSFLVIEKADDLGGTWHENRYPGCACDIPSHLYSFSFDSNPDWTRMYSRQPEIWDYLKSCAHRYGILPFIRFRTRLIEAAWDENQSLWRASLSDGSTLHARVLISGMGALHVPHYPEVPGIERFAGPAFHSATWASHIDLAGKNIAVIGTGASAIQFVPHIAPIAGKLTLFQRTPAWILPRIDAAIPDTWQRRFRRFPALMWIFRKLIFLQHEIRVFGFLGNERIRRLGTKMALEHLASQVADPKLRAALTPDYELGCKRVLASNDFYPALTRPNAELVTDAIAEIREHSIVTAGGVEHPIDVIIYGTGFHVTEPFKNTRIIGRGGIEIHTAWKQRAGAFLGITVPAFPNFFMLLGPNTGLGHNSVVLMIEAQIRYVMSCLKLMKRRSAPTLEVSQSSYDRFLEEVRTRIAKTVWQTGGCRSWYQDAQTGENPTIWPASVISYIHRTRTVNPNDYRLSN